MKVKIKKKIIFPVLMLAIFIASIFFPLLAQINASYVSNQAGELPRLFYDHKLWDYFDDQGIDTYCINPFEKGAHEYIDNQPVTIHQLDNIMGYEKYYAACMVYGYPATSWNVSAKDAKAITAMSIRALAYEAIGYTSNAEEYVSIQNGEQWAKDASVNLIKYAKANPKEYSHIPSVNLTFLAPTLDGKAIEYPNDTTQIGVKVKINFKDASSTLPIEIASPLIDNSKIAYPKEVINGQEFWITFPKELATSSGTLGITSSWGGKAPSIMWLETQVEGYQNYLQYTDPIKNVVATINATYEAQVSDFEMLKIDDKTGEPVVGATFQVFKGDKDNKDWSPKDYKDTKNLIGEFITGADGRFLIKGSEKLLLPSEMNGQMFAIETKAPAGYKPIDPLQSPVMKVDFSEFGRVGENSIKFTAVNEKDTQNVFKKDELGVTLLPGAEFQVLNEDGSKAKVYDNQGKEVSEAPALITDEKGQIQLPSGLKLGKYRLLESKAPEGYLLNKHAFPFEFKLDEKGEDIVVLNEKEYQEVSIQKNSLDQVMLKGQDNKYEFYEIRNESNTPLDHFKVSDPLGSKFQNLYKLSVGTFVEPEAYSIFLTDEKGKKQKINVPWTDKDDRLKSVGMGLHYDSTQTQDIGNLTKNTTDILANDKVWGNLNSSGIKVKELEVKLLPTSKTTGAFTLPSGVPDGEIIITTVNGTKSLGSYTAGQEVKLPLDTLEYKLVFNEATVLSNFDSGTFTSEARPPIQYEGTLLTNKGRVLNFKGATDKVTIVNILDFNLGIDETIEAWDYTMQKSVLPGFHSIDKAENERDNFILTKTKDLQPLADQYWEGNSNQLVFANTVYVSGDWKGNKVDNADEVDTVTYEKDLRLLTTGSLPQTGQMIFILLGIIVFGVGIGSIVVYNKLKKRNNS